MAISNSTVKALKEGNYSDRVLHEALLLKGGEEQELFALARESGNEMAEMPMHHGITHQ